MQISITGDLKKLLNKAKKFEHLRDDAWDDLRTVSFQAEYNIKIDCPVRTGRARGSWGHWEPSKSPDASPGDAYWKETRTARTMSIKQGSNVAYFPALRAGHSQQRPYDWVALHHKKASHVLAGKLRQRIKGYGFG